jgi:signal peptidase I
LLGRRYGGAKWWPYGKQCKQSDCSWCWADIIYANCHRAPDDCDELLLKRVVGLEGDIVRDRDNIARRVPTGHCWVEGDNGPRSTRDSNKLGPV